MVSVVLIVFLSPVTFAADNKDFYESGQIVAGEVWNMVNIYNDDTVVDMSGGMCDQIWTYHLSTLNITGGQAQVWAQDHSVINISDGTISNSAYAYLNSTINYSGSAFGHNLGAFDSGKVYMTGGTIENIGSSDLGIVNLYGGTISDSLFASGSAVINMFGYDLVKSYSGGNYDNGWVSGFWSDDIAFNIDLYGSETYSHINLIPEPFTIWLLGLGCLRFMRKRTCKVIR